MTELIEQINNTVRGHSGSLSLSNLNSNIPVDLKISTGSKRSHSAFLKNQLSYKNKHNYGHLATCVMLSLVLNGSNFLSQIESKGVLLCVDHCNSRFKEMLSRLYDASGQLSTGVFLRKMFQTYIIYLIFIRLLSTKLIN